MAQHQQPWASGYCRLRCAWDGLQLHPCSASPQHDLTGIGHVLVGACRADQSTCYNESSPWYEATHHGLDSMMQRIISELTLMTKDTDADLNIATNTRWACGSHCGALAGACAEARAQQASEQRCIAAVVA